MYGFRRLESPALFELIRPHARRVARAFGLAQFKRDTDRFAYIFVGEWPGSISIRYLISHTTFQLEWISIHQVKKKGTWREETLCHFDFSDGVLTPYGVDSDSPHLNALAAPGLYRLGIDDDEVWRELGVSLTAHEKLELRLAFPREFWPQKWLDEENV